MYRHDKPSSATGPECRKLPDARIPVLLMIDVEPDGLFIDRDSSVRWSGFERGFLWMATMRERIAARTGRAAAFAWGFRLDAQIEAAYGHPDWALREYRECIDEFLLHDDAIGVHTHLFRWSDALAGWVMDQGDPAWVEHNVRLSVSTMNDCLGRQPDFFRFGDRWMSNAAMALLDELGVPFELSLEPGREGAPSLHPGKPSTGSVPSQRSVPRKPYRPSSANFRIEDESGGVRIIEIPCTTGRVRPASTFVEAPSVRNAWAWMRYRSFPWIDTAGLYQIPEKVRSLVDDALSDGAPYLALPIRTDSFSKGLADGHLERVFELLLDHPLAQRFEFTTPRDLVQCIAPELTDGITTPHTQDAAASARGPTPMDDLRPVGRLEKPQAQRTWKARGQEP